MHATTLSRKIAVVALGATFAFFPALSRASGCVSAKTVNIHFKKGAACWYYAGRAEQFDGMFSGDQKVIVHMEGEGWEQGSHGQLKSYWAGRSPSIAGPHKFFAMPDMNAQDTATGTIRTVLPVAGLYHFSFSPCAMWGGYGHVSICLK